MPLEGGIRNLKKSRCHILSKDIKSIVQFIERLCAKHTVSLLCRLLEIPRSVDYFYKNKPLIDTEIRNSKLKKKISTFFLIINSVMVQPKYIK